LYLTADGSLAYDPSDEVQAAVVITHDGRVVHQDVADLLAAQPGPDPEGVADVDGTAD
jgi:hypothetical protein